MKSLFNQLLGLSLLLGLQTAGANSVPADMPKGLWQAFSEGRHLVEQNKEQEDEYSYRAYNPKHGYSILYGKQGLMLKKGDWELAMSLEAYGQEKNLKAVQKPALNTEGNTVTFDRGNVSEWYINRPSGLEQDRSGRRNDRTTG